MTDDIDGLEGVALDRAIHLEVMGGSEDDLHRQVSGRTYVTREMAMDAGDLSLEGTVYSDDEWEHVAPPPYSSTWPDFGQAFDRVTKPEPEGLGLRIALHTGGRGDEWTWVHMRRLADLDHTCDAEGTGNLKAVFLRAALKAVRVKTKRGGVAS